MLINLRWAGPQLPTLHKTRPCAVEENQELLPSSAYGALATLSGWSLRTKAASVAWSKLEFTLTSGILRVFSHVLL